MIKIAWDDTKTDGTDDVLAADYNERTTQIKARSKVSSGTTAPTSTPDSVGDIYVDTTNLKIYIATGTSSSSDWKKVLTQ